MFTISRRRARTFRVAIRRCVAKGRPRGPDSQLQFVSGNQGSFLLVPFDEVTVGYRLRKTSNTDHAFAIPLEVFAQVEGSDESAVTFEPISATQVQVTWKDREGPKSTTVPTVTEAPCKLPEVPSHFTTVDHSLLSALHEAGRCTAKESGRYALSFVQVRGQAGQVIGSDGKQALVMGGFHFPFSEDVLIPAVPLFGMNEWTSEGPIRVGKTTAGLCLTIGDWFIWLKADKSGKFPDVDSVIRRNSGGTRLHVSDDDAAQLLAQLPKLPSTEDDSSVTLCLNNSINLLASTYQSSPAELRLVSSSMKGPKCQWTFDWRYFHRALLLGFRDFSARKPTESLVATRSEDYFLFALMQPAVPQRVASAVTIQSPEVTPPISVKPIRSHLQRNPIMPPPENSPGPSEAESIDPLVEIEALRSLLAEAVTRSVKLLSAMKNYRRQRKAIESAWSSLQQLKLGTGG